MSKRDRRQQKKQKRRQERIRQEKHQRQATPWVGVHPSGDEAWEDGGWDEAGPTDDVDRERILRLVAWKAERLGPDGTTALSDLLDTQVGSDRWRQEYAQMVAADPQERAQDLAFRALEAEMADDIADARALAVQALEVDPDNLDALGLLLVHPSRPVGAGRRQDRATALPHDPALDRCRQALERAIQTPALAQALQRQAGDAWSQVGLRPFLRAGPVVLNRLTASQDLPGAIALAATVHALDRARDPAHGERLVGLYLAAGHLEDARRLLDRDVDDDDPFTVWARAWERFLAGDVDSRNSCRLDSRYSCRVLPPAA